MLALKQCRYVDSDKGCHRGTECEYLHDVKKIVKEKEGNGVKDIETQTECQHKVVKETVEKDIQTEAEKKCNCEVDCEENDVIIKDDKIICVLKRAKCSDLEWKEYEEKVESEIDLKDLLEDLGKVIEAASRLSEKNKEQQLVNNNINKTVAENSKKEDSMENVMQGESDEATKKGWIYCKVCEYKCKKKNTFKKHLKTKHSQCIFCDECGKLFTSEYSLDIHRESNHKENENESDQSFVFSESMLDEFL